MPKKEEDKRNDSIKTQEERDRIKELEKQIRSLQIENAFLKELRKLREREAQRKHEKQSQELS